jgi:hypothetical protein
VVDESTKPFVLVERGVQFSIAVQPDSLSFVLKGRQEMEPDELPPQNPLKWRQGNSLELFFDTRGGNSPTMNRFSHHFVIFPMHVEGICSKEVTKFRGTESRALGAPNQIALNRRKQGEMYSLTIPWGALYGVNLEDSPIIAFGFRLNQPKSHCCFPQATKQFESNPSMWAELV